MTTPLPDSADELIPLIADTAGVPVECRIQAISRLADLLVGGSHPMGFACLLSVLQDEMDARVISHTVSVLARLKAYSAVMSLIDVAMGNNIALFETQAGTYRFSEEAVRLRCTAVRALGRMGDDRAIIPLMSLLNDRSENYRLRLDAAESLGKLGDQHAVKPLLDIVSDDREKSLYLKESAVKALGMLGDIRAIEPLIDILESKKGFRDKFQFLKEQIIEAIGRIGGGSRKATRSLLSALRDDAPSIRLAAVEALGLMGDGDTLEALETMVFDADEDVAMASVAAVHRVGGKKALRRLLGQDGLPAVIRDEIVSYLEDLDQLDD
jgi:HEAT repeat protein